MSYYFSKKLALGFEEAIEKVTEALKSEGFGILTEIDVKETLKKNDGKSRNEKDDDGEDA